MSITELIEAEISSQPESKSNEMKELHELILQIMPKCKLWFDNGKNNEGKTINNPTIGYGLYTIHYANGKTRDFFRIGMSANTTGISIYIMGIKNKSALKENFGNTIGKASITGYCIKFKTIKNINLEVLKDAILFGVQNSEID